MTAMQVTLQNTQEIWARYLDGLSWRAMCCVSKAYTRLPGRQTHAEVITALSESVECVHALFSTARNRKRKKLRWTDAIFETRLTMSLASSHRRVVDIEAFYFWCTDRLRISIRFADCTSLSHTVKLGKQEAGRVLVAVLTQWLKSC